MSSVLFPGEKIILSSKAGIEQPIRGNGEAYLTEKRLLIIHKSGLIRKREIPLADIRLDQISYAKVEGWLLKTLVIGVSQGGTIIAYKIRVPNPDSWLAAIMQQRARM